MTNYLFNHTHLNRLLPSTLGFERLLDTLEHATENVNSNSGFPPVNVVRDDEFNYTVELAIAGYKINEIDITSEKNRLKITGKKVDDEEREYIVKGIAGRSFVREFVLADTVIVRDAILNDGILTVKLENVIPEEQKPRKILINDIAT